MRIAPLPTVFVFVPLEYAYYRDALSGVARYAGRKWRLIVAPAFPSAEQYRLSEAVGYIGPLFSPAQLAVVTPGDRPAVNISSHMAEGDQLTVRPNNYRLGVLAAEHLLSRGYRYFAAGGGSGGFESIRTQGFADRLRTGGFEVIRLPTHLSSAFLQEGDYAVLRDLPKPIGIFGPIDRGAARMMTKAIDAGFNVPGEFAFVGVDNDPSFCLSSLPHLTSVDPAADVIGFRAAQLLDEVLEGGKPPRQPIEIAPRGVVARGSTDLARIEDREIAQIVTYIREHACRGIAVKNVAEHFAYSRRTLERRFISVLNHSVLDEIRLHQFEHARELLTQTDLKVEQIAGRCGFNDYRNFIKQFSQHEGTTPSRYRKSRRMK